MATDLIDPAMEAAAQLPRELAVIKIENDQIFSMAAARPRDFVQVRKDLSAMIEEFPGFADEAIYEKPVGKDDSGHMKYARGLSVRAAECLAESYGFNRIRTDVESLPDGRVKIHASFTDYQRGRTWEDSSIVSPFYQKKGGGLARHPEDRFLNVVVRAEKSKLVREVINRSVNQALKAWFENECEKKLARTLTDDVVNKIVGGFKQFNMGLEQVEQVVGRPKAMGWTEQDRFRLVGVFNSLKNGDTTVAELLGNDTEPRKPPTATGTVDAMTNPQGGAEATPPKGSKKSAKAAEEPATTTPPADASAPKTTAAKSEKTALQGYTDRYNAATTIEVMHAINIDVSQDDSLSEADRLVLLKLFKDRKAALGLS